MRNPPNPVVPARFLCSSAPASDPRMHIPARCMLLQSSTRLEPPCWRKCVHLQKGDIGTSESPTQRLQSQYPCLEMSTTQSIYLAESLSHGSVRHFPASLIHWLVPVRSGTPIIQLAREVADKPEWKQVGAVYLVRKATVGYVAQSIRTLFLRNM